MHTCIQAHLLKRTFKTDKQTRRQDTHMINKNQPGEHPSTETDTNKQKNTNSQGIKNTHT